MLPLSGHRVATRFLRRIARRPHLAREIGVGVNAGHDLDLVNIPAYARAVKGLQEVSIGHALVSDALYMASRARSKAYLKALGSEPLDAKRKLAKPRLLN